MFGEKLFAEHVFSNLEITADEPATVVPPSWVKECPLATVWTIHQPEKVITTKCG